MNTEEAEKLLKQMNQVKYPKNIKNKPRKRRNETDRDYVLRTNGFRCRYSNRKLPSNKLSLITLYPERTDLPKWRNLGCAWTDYAIMKGSMNDDEFRKVLSTKKKEIRKEAFEYSQEIKKTVFERNNYNCIYCQFEYGFTPKDRTLTIDHKTPISKGGTNDLEKNFKNLTSACKQHNYEKKNLTAPEYFKFLEKRKSNNIHP
jgi:hypothetical protein